MKQRSSEPDLDNQQLGITSVSETEVPTKPYVDQLDQALSFALTIKDEYYRLLSIFHLSSLMNMSHQQYYISFGLDKANQLAESEQKVRLYTNVLQSIDGSYRTQILLHSLELLEKIANRSEAIKIIQQLVQNLNSPNAPELDEIIASTPDYSYSKANLYIAIAKESTDESVRLSCFELAQKTAKNIKNPILKNTIWCRLASVMPDNQQYIVLAREFIVKQLVELQNKERWELLEFLKYKEFFCSPIFDVSYVKEIVDDIVYICWDWEWL
jgi:hypothetical protein